MAQTLSPEQRLPAQQARTDTPHRAGRRQRRRARWGFWLFPLLFVGLLALAAVSAVAGYQWWYAGRVYPGVSVAGIPLGGLSLEQAEAAVRDDLTPYPGAAVTLRYDQRAWSFSPDSLGVSVDAAATAADAFAVGRAGGQHLAPAGNLRDALAAQWQGLRDDWLAQYHAAVDGYGVAPRTQLDDSRITAMLAQLAGGIDLAPQEGSLTISGLDVIAVPGRVGRHVDVTATQLALLRAAQSGQGGTVTLVVQEQLPAVRSVDQAAARATALLAQPLTLVTQGYDGSHEFAVDRATLRQWLQFAVVPAADGTVDLQTRLDSGLVTAYLQQIAAQMDRPVHDAVLDFDPDTYQISVLKPSQVGQRMDVKAGLAAIQAAVSDPAFLQSSGPHTITVPVSIVEPKVDSNKTAEMGIVEVVSQGTTTFAGSSADRVHNIVTAAGKFQNVVVPPGEEFSFNQYVGDITAANGFTDGLVIAGDRTAVGVGGGVCQVSTTAYRAALVGGFPITQRYAHGYVVGWYGKPGLDATIYTPDVDFRFRNDSGHFLFIRSSVDTDKGQITFTIYGTKLNRTVEISDPVISNVRDPEKPVYQEDDTLAPGEIKQVDWAVKGMDTVVVRRVQDADGAVHEEQIKSHYQPWRAVYLYGPGTRLPAGAQ